MVLNRVLRGSPGLNDWILQRVSAIFLWVYLSALLFFWVASPVQERILFWRTVLLAIEMRVLGVLAMAALVVHAWIGSWVVATDYLHVYWLQRVTLVLLYLLTIMTAVVVCGVLLVA